MRILLGPGQTHDCWEKESAYEKKDFLLALQELKKRKFLEKIENWRC
jgi:hypothetical protein